MLRSLAVSAMLLFAVSPAFAAPAASSSGWQARIVGSEASPSRLIAVDKNDQTLFLFERHSPLRLAGKYACTTGQNDGDKLEEGDLKTPEGVYFVIRRIGSGLNFEKYGYEAYTLNYPNPVDKLRKKTGYGIWIHGRGSPITPKVTEGCVSLNNTDIAVLGENLTPGTPVALADKVSFTSAPSAEDKAVINSLYKRTHDWAKAWADRSKKFFDYYDADSYSLAQGESFKAFREQKERVFKNVSFIDNKLENVQALQGPGYWVTWFQQDYRASNLSTKGIRRLYWQKDKKGEWRIIGMEWAPHLSGTLTAGLNGAPLSAESATAKADKPVEKPAAKPADKPVAVAAATPPATVPAAVAAPEKAPQPQPAAPTQPSGHTPPQAAPAPVPAAEPLKPAGEPVALALAEMAGKPAPQVEAAPKPAPKSEPQQKVDTSKQKKVPVGDVSAFIETWRKAWEKGDLQAYAGCYDAKAVQGSRTGVSAIRSHKAGLWKKSHPKQVMLTNVRITTNQDMVVADMHQAYTDSKSFADMGIKTLYLQVKDNAWRIVREDWSPMQQ